ncbi:hypothetical protein QBC46DRAFT_397703 [Diplogelasinospora grovesii]|uniref:Uncharacterized protein n=1 Tax=Diplogelasinospora grovesii TaxID=303347 RepID=A0AAN6MZD9_9PEZI|nr:hypothetical protein QBC46DRAFT_397703 [Diplogelasinospora grovesii]
MLTPSFLHHAKIDAMSPTKMRELLHMMVDMVTFRQLLDQEELQADDETLAEVKDEPMASTQASSEYTSHSPGYSSDTRLPEYYPESPDSEHGPWSPEPYPQSPEPPQSPGYQPPSSHRSSSLQITGQAANSLYYLSETASEDSSYKEDVADDIDIPTQHANHRCECNNSDSDSDATLDHEEPAEDGAKEANARYLRSLPELRYGRPPNLRFSVQGQRPVGIRKTRRILHRIRFSPLRKQAQGERILDWAKETENESPESPQKPVGFRGYQAEARRPFADIINGREQPF